MLIHLGQHVVQAVTEFMEQGNHVVVGEHRRFAVYAICKVAHQMGYRRLRDAIVGT